MPLYTVINTRTITEAHTIWAHSPEGARDDVEHAYADSDHERDVRRKPTLLDHGLRNVQSITLVREDS